MKKMYVILVSIAMLFSTFTLVTTADWGDTWEFTYDNQDSEKDYESQGIDWIEKFNEEFPNNDNDWTGTDDGDTAQDEYWYVKEEVGDASIQIVSVCQEGVTNRQCLQWDEIDPAGFASGDSEGRASGNISWNPDNDNWAKGFINFSYAYYVDTSEGLQFSTWNGTDWDVQWQKVASGNNELVDWTDVSWQMPAWVFDCTDFGFKFVPEGDGPGDYVYLDSVTMDVYNGTPDFEDENGWWNSEWSYRKLITWDTSQVSGSLTNFPCLVNISSDSDLNSHAQPDGDDIVFIDYTDNSTQLNHEIEYYSGGTLVAWVNDTNMDTLNVWMYYGNDSCGSQEHVADTWHSDFTYVEHFDEASGNLVDSTVNAVVATANGNPTYQQTGGSMGLGYYIDFDNDGDCFALPSDCFDENSDFSLECVCAFDDYDDRQMVLQFRDDATIFALYYHEVRDQIDCNANDGASYHNVLWDANPSYTGFRSYVLTWDESITTRKTFLSGTYIATEGHDIKDDEDTSYIGADDGVASELNGKITEMRFCKGAILSDDFITTSYNTMNNATDGGFFALGSEETESGVKPTVVTQDARGVEEQNATLRGLLSNNGSADTTCWFIYGDETPPTDNNVSQGVIESQAYFEYNWSGLTEGQIYYFDTAANNSEGFDSSGGIEGFLTKPETPTSLDTSDITGGVTLSWTHGTGYNSSVLVRKTTGYPSSPTDGTVIYNGSDATYEDTSLSKGTNWYRVWEYSSWDYSEGALQQFSDGNESLRYEFQGTYYAYTNGTLSFGGFADITGDTIDVDINCTTWSIGDLATDAQIRKNFTFYQNGTAEIDINITLNETNLSFVNYTTWNADGYMQYCANVTNDSWATETNIITKVGGYPSTWLNQNVSGDSSFTFGIRIWMPKTINRSGLTEDFVIWTLSWSS